MRKKMLEKQTGTKKNIDKSTIAKKPSTKKRKKAAPKPKADTESEKESSEESANTSEEKSDVERTTKKKKQPSCFISKKDRPDHLKSDRKLNKLTLDEVISICRLSAKLAKLDSAAVDTDDKPEKINYKNFKDNGIDQLHPARFERHPTTAPSKWWSNVPIKRTNIIKKIPLRHLGNFLELMI